MSVELNISFFPSGLYLKLKTFFLMELLTSHESVYFTSIQGLLYFATPTA